MTNEENEDRFNKIMNFLTQEGFRPSRWKDSKSCIRVLHEGNATFIDLDLEDAKYYRISRADGDIPSRDELLLNYEAACHVSRSLKLVSAHVHPSHKYVVIEAGAFYATAEALCEHLIRIMNQIQYGQTYFRAKLSELQAQVLTDELLKKVAG